MSVSRKRNCTKQKSGQPTGTSIAIDVQNIAALQTALKQLPQASVGEVYGWLNSVATPVSNTGSDFNRDSAKVALGEGLTVGIDYFRATFKLPNRSWVEELVGAFVRLLKDEPIWEYNQGSFYGKQWKHRGRSVKGLKWYWCDSGEGQQHAHLLIEASGSVISQIPIKEFWQFSKFLNSGHFNTKATRFDIAIDDYKKRIKEGSVVRAMKREDYGIVQEITIYKTRTRRKDKYPGFCYYFGSPNSDSYARFYDRDAKTEGDCPTYRIEGEFKDKKAHLVWLKWLSIEEESFDELSPHYLAGSALGIVEFVDRKHEREKDKNRGICIAKRLPWWSKFIKAVGAHIRHSVPREDRTFEKMLGWLERQVVGSLAMAQKVMGILDFRKWLDWQMDVATANFRREQKAKIVQWSKGKSDICQRTDGAVDVKDEDGEKWIWVWRETAMDRGWMRARMLSANATSVKVRFSGESSKNVSKRLTHFGEDKPTWVPAFIGDMVKELVDSGRIFEKRDSLVYNRKSAS